MLDTSAAGFLPLAGGPKKGWVVLHPDSTTLPVAESTVQFAVGDQLLPGADLDSSLSGRWVYALGARLPTWVSGLDLTIMSSSEALTPTNRGVNIPNYGQVEVVPQIPDSVWVSPLGVPVIDSVGCDWLTLTATADRGMRQLYDLMLPLADERRALGDDTREGKELQYKGHRVGRHLFYGESDRQGAYLRVSSSVASTALERVCRFQERYFRATRYDAQLTAVYDGLPGSDFFDSMAMRSQQYGEEVGSDGRPWRCEVRKTLGRGDTAYVGVKESAEVYGCSYDKHKEGLKLGVSYPEGAVRFEIRHRREMANMHLAEVCAAENPRDYTAGYVRGWYRGRGIDLQLETLSVAQLRGSAHQSDAEKRRKWFRSQVRRAAQLNARFVGLEETLKDLGLWEDVCKQFLEGN